MNNGMSDTLYRTDAYFYDLDNRPALKEDIPFYLEYASKIGRGIHILELACGTGRITIPLAEAGHEIWALEYSEAMIDVFKNKLKNLPEEVRGKIHLLYGDMSDFEIQRKFPLILLPARSFQLLLEETKEISCLRNVHLHLEDTGYFIIEIADFIGKREKEKEWVSEQEVFDWENIDPGTGFTIRRTHVKKAIDTARQIIYPQKRYYITKNNGSVEKVIKQAAWKYFFEDQIRNLLISNGFRIIKEMGSFDGRPIHQGSLFIFICQK
jgi:SAM-dependent methyltransferase